MLAIYFHTLLMSSLMLCDSLSGWYAEHLHKYEIIIFFGGIYGEIVECVGGTRIQMGRAENMCENLYQMW